METLIAPIFDFLESWLFIFKATRPLTFDGWIVPIVLLSILVSILMIPFELWASKFSRREREIMEILAPQISAIKASSNGQMRHHRIQKLYQRYRYHPLYSIRGLVGLLIQLPVLVSAYYVIKDYEYLQGAKVLRLGIKDLSEPDALLYGINVLPFVMFAMSCLVTFATPHLGRGGRLKALGVGLCFLVLLYNSPSGLLVFWTTSLFFNLCKQIVNRLTKGQYLTSKWLSFFLASKPGLPSSSFSFYSPAAIFLFVLTVYMFCVQYFYPSGHSETAARITMWISAILLIPCIVMSCVRPRDSSGSSNSKSNRNSKIFAGREWWWLILPLLPLLHYVNVNEVYFSNNKQALLFLGGLLYIPAVILIISFSARKLANIPSSLPSASILAVALYFTMPLICGSLKIRSEDSFWVQLIFLGVGLSLIILLNNRLTNMLNFISVILLLLVGSEVLESSAKIKPKTSYPKPEFLSGVDIKRTPDIFFLSYESFPDTKMSKFYGVDLSPIEDSLTKSGFTIYPESFSLDGFTKGSLLMTLSLKYVDRWYSDPFYGNNPTHEFLHRNGYSSSVVLSPGLMLTHKSRQPDHSNIDYYYGDKSHETANIDSLWKGIREGEFKFTNELTLDEDSFHAARIEQFQRLDSKPKFVLTHTSKLLTHSQNSGKLHPSDLKKFHKLGKLAITKIPQEVDVITSQDLDNAIIVVAGDHGPYLTGDGARLDGYKADEINSVMVTDRYGVFLAIRWPDGGEFARDLKITKVQDVFLAIFAYMADDPELFKKNRLPDTFQVLKRPDFATDAGRTILHVKDGILQFGPDKGKGLYYGIPDQYEAYERGK